MQRFTHLPCPAASAASNSWLVKAAVALALLALAACVAAIVGTAGVSDSLALRDAPSVDVVVAEKVAEHAAPPAARTIVRNDSSICLGRVVQLMLRGDGVIRSVLPRCSTLTTRGDEETWFEYPPSPDQTITVPYVQLHSMDVVDASSASEPRPALRGPRPPSPPPPPPSRRLASQTGKGPAMLGASSGSEQQHKECVMRRSTPIYGSAGGDKVLADWMARFRSAPRNGLAQCDGLVCEMGPIAYSLSIHDEGALTTFPVPVPTRFRDAFGKVEARLEQLEPGVITDAVRASAVAAAQKRAGYPLVDANTTLEVESAEMMTITARDGENVLRRANETWLLEMAAQPASRLWPGSSLVLHFAYYSSNNPGHAMMVMPSLFKMITGLCYPIDRVFSPLWRVPNERFPFGTMLMDMFVWQMKHRCNRSVAVVSAPVYADSAQRAASRHYVDVLENVVVLDLVASSWVGRQALPIPTTFRTAHPPYRAMGLMHDMDTWHYDSSTGMAMKGAAYCLQGIQLQTPWWQRMGHAPLVARNPCAQVTSLEQARREQGLVVFLLRNPKASRYIVNMEEVHTKLGPVARRLGLKLVGVDPAEVELDELVDQLSRAAMVVAPHGGVMGNAVFCRPNSVWVEVFQRNLWWLRRDEMTRVIEASGMLYNEFIITEPDSVVLMPSVNGSAPMKGTAGIPFSALPAMDDPEVYCPGDGHRCRLHVQHSTHIKLPVDRLVAHLEPLLVNATHPCAADPALWQRPAGELEAAKVGAEAGAGGGTEADAAAGGGGGEGEGGSR